MSDLGPWLSPLRGALLITSVIVAVTGWSGSVRAQATGQVNVESAGAGASRSLASLQQLLLAPPEPELNLLLVPRYSIERYDAYSEAATFPIPVIPGVLDPIGTIEDAFQMPEITIETAGISGGLDYLFPNGMLLGGSLNYSHADFDFDEPSPATRQQQAIRGDRVDFLAAAGAGDPVDRDFDEYGGTLAVGYLQGPLTLLLTGGVFYRDNEARRREFANSQVFTENSAEFDSWRYSVEAGAAYRFELNWASLQPFVTIEYSREEVDGFFEDVDKQFADPELDGDFDRVLVSPDMITRRRFNDQTIEAIPLSIGALASVPFGGADASGESPAWIALSRFTAGFSYTHDFEDQERTIVAEAPNAPGFTVRADEENRNQDLVTLIGSLDLNVLGRVFTTFTYERDFGFDERESADTVTLQLRIPL